MYYKYKSSAPVEANDEFALCYTRAQLKWDRYSYPKEHDQSILECEKLLK